MTSGIADIAAGSSVVHEPHRTVVSQCAVQQGTAKKPLLDFWLWSNMCLRWFVRHLAMGPGLSATLGETQLAGARCGRAPGKIAGRSDDPRAACAAASASFPTVVILITQSGAEPICYD